MPALFRKPWFLGLLLFAVAVIPRLILVFHPPAAIYLYDAWVNNYTFDEFNVVNGLVDRFLGAPAVNLMWPVSTLHDVELPLWLAGAFSHGIPHSANAGLQQLIAAVAHTLQYPRHTLTQLRVLNAVGSSFSCVLAFLTARRLGAPTLYGFLAGIAIALNPIYFEQSSIAAGEGFALLFALLALYVLATGALEEASIASLSTARLLTAGACFGAAIGSKYIIGPAGLLFLLWLGSAPTWRHRARTILLFLAGCSGAVLFFVPWIITDPIRLSKSIIGSVMAKSGSASFPMWWSLNLYGMGWAELVLAAIVAVAAVIALIRTRGRLRYWLLVSLLVLFVQCHSLYRQAGDAYPRYIVVNLFSLYCIGVGFAVWTRNERAIVARSLACLSGLLLLAAAFGLLRFAFTLRYNDGFDAAIEERSQFPAGTLLYVPFRTNFTHESIFGPEHLRKVLDNSNRLYMDDPALGQFLEHSGLQPQTYNALRSDFTEYEQARAARVRVLLPYAKPQPWQFVVYHTDPVIRDAWQDATAAEAIADWKLHPGSAFLIECNTPPTPGAVPAIKSGLFCWYLR